MDASRRSWTTCDFRAALAALLVSTLCRGALAQPELPQAYQEVRAQFAPGSVRTVSDVPFDQGAGPGMAKFSRVSVPSVPEASTADFPYSTWVGGRLPLDSSRNFRFVVEKLPLYVQKCKVNLALIVEGGAQPRRYDLDRCVMDTKLPGRTIDHFNRVIEQARREGKPVLINVSGDLRRPNREPDIAIYEDVRQRRQRQARRGERFVHEVEIPSAASGLPLLALSSGEQKETSSDAVRRSALVRERAGRACRRVLGPDARPSEEDYGLWLEPVELDQASWVIGDDGSLLRVPYAATWRYMPRRFTRILCLKGD